jgi:RNA polymerase sigma-70 factor (ECF subfamily)
LIVDDRVKRDLVSFDREIRRKWGDEPLQEAYLRILRLKTPQTIREMGKYLTHVTANVAREFRMRAQDVSRVVTFDSEAAERWAERAPEATTDEQADLLDAEQRLMAALAKLPKHYVDVLLLTKRDGLSYQEVAKKLGLSEDSVKKYIVKGKARLAEVMEELSR